MPNPWHSDLGFPFRDEAHRRECWIKNRDWLLEQQSETGFDGFWTSYPVGHRPVAYWKYEIGSTETKSEFAYLKKHNLLFPGEEKQYEKLKTIKAHIGAAHRQV